MNRLKDRFLAKKASLYQSEINLRNYKSFQDFAIVGAIIAFFILVFGLILSNFVTFNMEFFIIFCYFIIMLLTSKLYLKNHLDIITPAFYIALTPLMLISILMGTVLDPHEPTITFMVFISVLTLFVLDRPWRILLFNTVLCIIYGVVCYSVKDYSMFMADLIDLVAFYFLSLGINFFILNDRLDNVENYIKFREKSEIDLLTGLYNRGTGVEKIETLIQQQVYGAFIIIDIDKFKQINDTYGHMGGDDVLFEVAVIIKNYFKEDIVFRMGGDEFIVYAAGMIDKSICEEIFEDILKALKLLNVYSIDSTSVSLSLGCSIYKQGVSSYDYLYDSSDRCLYRAKKAGRGCYYINT